jgi:hypothetical protein
MGPSVSPWQLSLYSPRQAHWHAGVKNVAIIQLSPFHSLYRFLLARSLRRFHFRLNGGFESGFRRNAFGFSAPPFLYFSSSDSLSLFLFVGLIDLFCLCRIRLISLPNEWRLKSRLSMECIRLLKREVKASELALLAEALND